MPSNDDFSEIVTHENVIIQILGHCLATPLNGYYLR